MVEDTELNMWVFNKRVRRISHALLPIAYVIGIYYDVRGTPGQHLRPSINMAKRVTCQILPNRRLLRTACGCCEHTGKSHLPRRHTWAKFSKSNIPLSGVGNFNGTASMVSMVGGPGK